MEQIIPSFYNKFNRKTAPFEISDGAVCNIILLLYQSMIRRTSVALPGSAGIQSGSVFFMEIGAAGTCTGKGPDSSGKNIVHGIFSFH